VCETDKHVHDSPLYIGNVNAKQLRVGKHKNGDFNLKLYRGRLVLTGNQRPPSTGGRSEISICRRSYSIKREAHLDEDNFLQLTVFPLLQKSHEKKGGTKKLVEKGRASLSNKKVSAERIYLTG